LLAHIVSPTALTLVRMNTIARDERSGPVAGKSPRTAIKLRNVLLELGFHENWSAITDEQPGYCYDFGNLKLTAAQVTNSYLTPVFAFGGVARSPRTIAEISFDMPLEVESLEQGVAWVTYGLGRAFRPSKLTPWVDQGRKWSDTLPWEQDRRRYEARPHCLVDRDWFRLAAKKLRDKAGLVNANESASFQFDGKVLQIKTLGEFLAMPAEGVAWDRPYFVNASELDSLPKRMMRSTVEVNVWEGKLRIEGRAFALVQPANEMDRDPQCGFPVSSRN